VYGCAEQGGGSIPLENAGDEAISERFAQVD
jgi:hypothetical protein